MDFRVCRVAELLKQQEFFRIAGDNFFRFLNGAFHTFSAFGQYQVRTQCFQQLTTLNAHGLRHRQSQFVTASGGDIGQRNPGITTGWFDQLNARFQYPTFFGIPNHIGTDTAFDTKAWVT